MKNLSKYPPSESMLRALDLNFSDDILSKSNSDFAAYLETRQLSVNNVCSVLTILIGIEDIYTMQQYSELIQCNVQVGRTKLGNYRVLFSNKNNIGMCVPYVDNLVLLPKGTLPASMQPRRRIQELSRSGTIFEITTVTGECIVFRPSIYCVDSKKKLENTHYDVICRTPRIPFRLMYKSLNLFAKMIHARQYLFPVSDTQKKGSQVVTFPLVNSSIGTNPEQLQAVQQIVAGPNPMAPYIIFGPPGTGKSSTIVEAVLQLYLQKGAHILVTTSSNSACDSITLKIIEYFENDQKFKSLSVDNNKVLLRLVSRSRRRKVARSMDQLVLKYTKVTDSRNRINFESYGIIVATLCTAGLQLRQNSKPFTHIFIDEAASASEAELLLAIAGIKNQACHVILAGDHKQLGPVIKCERARSLGLDSSSMERLLLHKMYEVDSSGKYDTTLQSRLRRNYRAHPEIVGIYNKLYYNNQLIPMAPLAQVNQAANWSKLPNGKFPILFQATYGETETGHNSTSKFNKVEAQVVCWYVTNLLKNGLGGVRVEQKDIGIVTPYLAQFRLLKGILRLKEMYNVEVGTVGTYQGREKPIIIASLVSSYKGMRFFSDPRRVNVMVSRPKALFILIGDPITLSKNYDFKFIIDQCKAQGNLLYNKKDLALDNIDDLMAKLSLNCDEDEEEDENDYSYMY